MSEIPNNEEHKWAQGLERMRESLERMTPEERAEKENRRVDAENRRRQIVVNGLRQEMNAPERQLACVCRREGAWAEKLTLLEGKLGTGFTVGIVGQRGRGKTQMAVELMRSATDRRMSARFMTAVEFFMEIKASYRRESLDTELDIIRRYRRPKLLVIDEVGKRSENDWENSLLFELLNKRYNDMTDTVLIDNRPRKDFCEAIGASLASRIDESGGLIDCQWESFR